MHQNDASIFLGPPLGKTLVLSRDDGTVIKRTTTAISEAGVYFIEDKTRLPVKKIKGKPIRLPLN
ncbi:hypothetical protein [Desulfovibrio gilichinskyi]|uniref:Uncharacterized protein n=1 Tax=Desulfovibrio gilichinskyi TaxID=1519643 RepID=A0A1X7E199_9BACT|nr:hypothetical protein [Desulfovibrio gilichinskyi]SMF25530.1 hypothetical protein SAMN06295933_2486 [Desulfovibrio gilichinskyi]